MSMKRRVMLKGALAAGAFGAAIGTGLLSPRAAVAAWSADAFKATTAAEALKALLGSDSLEEIHKVLKIRKPLYNSMCDMSVACDTIPVDEIMDYIVKALPEGI